MTSGIVYVATGEGYVAEATRSAASAKRAMPDVAVCLVTDCDVQSPCFDVVVRETEVCRAPVDKLLAVRAPFDRCIFLDSDTYLVSDISDIFSVLERFDLALLHETRRGWDYSIEGVPHCFSEYNTGLIAFRRTPAVEDFFRRWRENYELLYSRLPVPNTDQPSFRKTVFETDVRVATLPSEYHFIGDSPNYIMWDAKMIHARGNYEEIARTVNSEMGGRVHIPNVGIFRGFRGRGYILKECARFASRSLSMLFHPPVDVTARIPKKWW